MKTLMMTALAVLMLAASGVAVAELTQKRFGSWLTMTETDEFTQETSCSTVLQLGAKRINLLWFPEHEMLMLQSPGAFVFTETEGTNEHRVKFDDGPILRVDFMSRGDSFGTFDSQMLPNLKKGNKIMLEGNFTKGADVHTFTLDGFTAALEHCEEMNE